MEDEIKEGDLVVGILKNYSYKVTGILVGYDNGYPVVIPETSSFSTVILYKEIEKVYKESLNDFNERWLKKGAFKMYDLYKPNLLAALNNYYYERKKWEAGE